MSVTVFDDRACILGEGPLWHPLRKRLFWFDIMGKRLMTRSEAGPQSWQFDLHVSAAGWIDRETLLIASEVDLRRFDLTSGESNPIVALEADNPITRSNDGRADPQGGFWIGTMGKRADPKAGALYRYYAGELRQLRADVTISNATCFAPDGTHAYFADTAAHLVWRVALDKAGWPVGDWHIYLDHREQGLNPDGAVVDANGRFWCAEWGASRVACYNPDGALVDQISLPVPQPSCPAFGGDDLTTLFVTTARQGLPDDAMDAAPLSGQLLSVQTNAMGQAEHQVRL